jgi:hypothetical protein
LVRALKATDFSVVISVALAAVAAAAGAAAEMALAAAGRANAIHTLQAQTKR